MILHSDSVESKLTALWQLLTFFACQVGIALMMIHVFIYEGGGGRGLAGTSLAARCVARRCANWFCRLSLQSVIFIEMRAGKQARETRINSHQFDLNVSVSVSVSTPCDGNRLMGTNTGTATAIATGTGTAAAVSGIRGVSSRFAALFWCSVHVAAFVNDMRRLAKWQR